MSQPAQKVSEGMGGRAPLLPHSICQGDAAHGRHVPTRKAERCMQVHAAHGLSCAKRGSYTTTANQPGLHGPVGRAFRAAAHWLW